MSSVRALGCAARTSFRRFSWRALPLFRRSRDGSSPSISRATGSGYRFRTYVIHSSGERADGWGSLRRGFVSDVS